MDLYCMLRWTLIILFAKLSLERVPEKHCRQDVKFNSLISFSFVLCSFDFSFFYFFLPLLYCNRCRHRIWSCIRRRKLSGGCIEISCWCGKFILFLALVGIFFGLIQIYPFEALEFLTWWFFFYCHCWHLCLALIFNLYHFLVLETTWTCKVATTVGFDVNWYP